MKYSAALVSKLTPLFVVDPYGIEKINPIPWASDIVGSIKHLNKVEKLGSSIYGGTWSDLLLRALGENQLLYDAFTSTTLNATFSKYSDLSLQFEAVSKLIKNKDVRGVEVDRDVFFVETGGFDTMLIWYPHSVLHFHLSNDGQRTESAYILDVSDNEYSILQI